MSVSDVIELRWATNHSYFRCQFCDVRRTKCSINIQAWQQMEELLKQQQFLIDKNLTIIC